MSTKEENLLAKLRAAFQVEAEEHLQAIGAGLVELECADDLERRKQIIAVILREAHSLKGAARAVNLNEIEAVCQSIESVFFAWKKQDVKPSPELFDPLHKAIDLISSKLPLANVGESALNTVEQMSALVNQLAGIESGTMPKDNSQKTTTQISPPLTQISTESTEKSEAKPAEKLIAPKAVNVTKVMPTTATANSLSDTFRISTAKLDALLLRSEELLAVKLSTHQLAVDLHSLFQSLALWEKEWSKIAPEWRVLRQNIEAESREGEHHRSIQRRTAAAVTKVAEFLEWNQDHIKSVQTRIAGMVKTTDQDRRAAAGMVDALLEDSKKLLMLPFATLFEIFPKLVRDLSRDQAKEVEIEIRGGDVEIDKRILEEMKDPLIHLLRNCVDHGIEKPAQRIAQGKNSRALITLAVSQLETNKVEILVSDDGTGIDVAQVKKAALRQKGTSTEEIVAMDDAEAVELIFRSEVSTSPVITEISGRGLGLAIVKEKVEKLGGRISVETTLHRGTAFRLQLPITVATFRGILVQESGQMFVLPTARVERVMRIRPQDIGTVEDRETIRLNNRPVSLVRLSDVLELPRSQEADASFIPVIILGGAEKRIACRVDSVIEEREVLVKRLGKPLVRVRNIAGATVLGNGKAVPILNISDLLKSATNYGAVTAPGAKTNRQSKTEVKSILVVDDSITARMLLKNIFESAGYRVKIAVDGMDAFTTLKTEPFHVVVSDVQMPRMDGFELITKIRSEKKLSELPVVLVTALASPEDRERGIEVGADAYIVKSRFDQSDLLDVVRRLV